MPAPEPGQNLPKGRVPGLCGAVDDELDESRSSGRPRPAAKMRIGQLILLEGRRYTIEGIDPMSVHPKRLHLRDVQTGEHSFRPLADVQRLEPVRKRP